MGTRSTSWLKGARARVFLAALGKHPAWDDHMEVGLESDALVRVRRHLYVEGIGAAIDSGAWDRLAPDESLPAFGHAFLWRLDRDLIVGRMWASRDGKGRSKYPMLACFHASGIGPGWAWRELAPRLNRLQADCAAAQTQEAVLHAVTSLRDAARAALDAENPNALLTPLPADLASLADAPELGPDRRGLHRILYECERELAPWRELAETTTSRTRPINLAGHRLRLPVLAGDGPASLARWTGIVLSLVTDSAPVFAVIPDEARWLDIIVGDLSPAHLACLRTTPRKMALTSDVPYTLDPAFIARANALIDASPSHATAPSGRPTTTRQNPAWFNKWLALAAALVIVAVAIAILVGRRMPTPAQPAPPVETPRVETPPRPGPSDSGLTPRNDSRDPPSSPPAQTDIATAPDPPSVAAGSSRSVAATPEPGPGPDAPPAADRRDEEGWSRLPATLGDAVLDEAWRRGLEQIRSAAPAGRALEQARSWHGLLKILAETPRRDDLPAADRAALDDQRARSWRRTIDAIGDASSATALASAQSRVRESFTRIARQQAELEDAAGDTAAALDSLQSAALAESLPAPIADLGDRLTLARAAGLPSAQSLAREVESWQAHPTRSVDELRAEIEDPRASPWRRAAAWLRLRDRGWPATVDQLMDEVRLQRLLATLPGAAELDALRRAESESRWLRAASAAGADPDAVRAVNDQLAPLGLHPSLVERAPAPFRLAHAINELRAAMGRPGLDDADARTAVETFLEASARAGGSPWDQALRQAITPPRIAPPLENVGPGSVGWACRLVDDGGRVTYISPRGISIEFIRLDALGSPDRAVYLSAAEISLAQFAEIAAKNWDALRPYLRYEEPDPRQGPRVWVLAPPGGDPIRRAANPRDPSQGWVVTFGRGSAYGDDDGPEPAHPMQQISARAAIVAARLVGCRLPTTTEWLAAHAHGPAPTQNLRDSRWHRHWQILRERAAAERGSVKDSEWPAAGIFRPPEAPAIPPADDDTPAVSTDDGVLWFAHAEGDSRSRNRAGFAHLVGNVAEWVFEDGVALEQLSDLSPASLTRLIGDGGRLGVIGASALSPGSIDPQVPQRVDSRRSREMFSDVGFRLAFVVRGVSTAAPERTVREKVEGIVREIR
jgi:hypothetical protein